MRRLTVLALLLLTSGMSSRQLNTQQLSAETKIPAVVSVRGPDKEITQMVASDLVALQIFESVRIDDQAANDYDLLVTYKPPIASSSGWVCGRPGAMVLLSILSLLITPSCVTEGVYKLEFMPSRSHETICVETDYKMTTWLGLHALLMNISPNWHFGPPDDNVRRYGIQLAILSKRAEILRMLNQGDVRPSVSPRAGESG